MRTVHIEKDDLDGWRDQLTNSYLELIIVHNGGYRMVLWGGRVMSSSGHSDIDVTPIYCDSRRDKIRSGGASPPKTRWTELDRRRIAEAMSEDHRDRLTNGWQNTIPHLWDE